MAERNIGPVSKIHGAGFPPELTPFIPPDTWHIIRTRLSSAHVRASDSFGSTCCCCYERYAREELRK